MELLAGAPFEIVGAGDISPPLPEIEETGATFDENAALKAQAASLHSGMLTLADDSGLEVDALGGSPGVLSARYATDNNKNASDGANRKKLLFALRDVSAPARSARFRCAIAVARGGKVILTSTGAVEGNIIETERGTGGFGYDPLFVPSGFDRTFAEMSTSEKAAISHRARALASLKPRLVELILTLS